MLRRCERCSRILPPPERADGFRCPCGHPATPFETPATPAPVRAALSWWKRHEAALFYVGLLVLLVLSCAAVRLTFRAWWASYGPAAAAAFLAGLVALLYKIAREWP